MWHCPHFLGLWVIPGSEMEVIRCGIKFTEWGLVDNEVVIELFILGRREWWLCQIQDLICSAELNSVVADVCMP